MQCIHCQSETVVKNGTRRLQDGQVVQYYRCRECHRNFNERTGTPMARLRTPSSVVEFAMKNRSEGMGARATGRVYDKSHGTILRWEERLADHVDTWSPPAPEGSTVTLEGDEVYTRVGENLPPLGQRRVDVNLSGA
jgi:transposase-like protein